MDEKAFLYYILEKEHKNARRIKAGLFCLILIALFAQYYLGKSHLTEAVNRQWNKEIDSLLERYKTDDEITLQTVIDSLHTITKSDSLKTSNTKELISQLENAKLFFVLLPLSGIACIFVFNLIADKVAHAKWSFESRLFYNTIRIGHLVPLITQKLGWFHQERALTLASEFVAIYAISPLQADWRKNLRYKWFADFLADTELEKILDAFDELYTKIAFCIKTKKLHNNLSIILDKIADFLFLLTINVDERLRKKIFLIKKPELLPDSSILLNIATELGKIQFAKESPIFRRILQKLLKIEKLPITIQMDTRIWTILLMVPLLLFSSALLVMFIKSFEDATLFFVTGFIGLVIEIGGGLVVVLIENYKSGKKSKKRA